MITVQCTLTQALENDDSNISTSDGQNEHSPD